MDPLQDSSEDVDWYEDGDNEKYQIYVGNLPNTLPEEQLKNLFEEYHPKRFRVFREGYKCFAFVSFEDSITMHHVLRQLNNCSLEGRCLVVSKSHRTSRSSCSSLQNLQLPDSTGEIKDYDQNCTEEKEIADNTFDEEEGYYNGRDVKAYSKAGEMPKDPVEEFKGTSEEFNKTDFAAASKDNFKQTYKEKSEGQVSPRNSNCGGWEDVPVQCCCSDDQSCSDVEQDVSCADFKKIRYCILKLEKKKLELEILKLRLEIQKLNKCGFRNKE